MKNSQLFSNLGTGILVLCAMVLTGIVVRGEIVGASSTRQQVSDVANWREIAATGHLMGAKTAKVQIVELSDFQCPFCAEAHRVLKGVRQKYGEQVAVVFRHFPLDSHPHAFDAARASECAGQQGAFERYHDVLFSQQDSIGVKPWERFAAEVNVADTDRFRACMAENNTRSVVLRDQTAARALNTRGTPTFIVNGKMFTGSLTPENWDIIVSGMLNKG